MSIRTPLTLTVAAGLAAPALAQSFTNDSSVAITLSWREATSSGGTVPNPNGELEPGEWALITMDVSFTNQFGHADFSPPIGTFTGGTIVGFGAGFLDINGSGGTQGTFNISTPQANSAGTSGFGVRSSWRLAGNGTVNPGSSGIVNLQFGQFVVDPALANTLNPITNMYRMLWQPNSFASVTRRFDPVGAAIAGNEFAAVYLDLNGTVGASIYVNPANVTFRGVEFPIPTPASSLILLAAAPWRRRRR
jgi:hypothetical protein